MHVFMEQAAEVPAVLIVQSLCNFKMPTDIIFMFRKQLPLLIIPFPLGK